jgi:hypothetical protein
VIIFLVEESGERLGLTVSDLERKPRAGTEMRRSGRDQFLDELVADGAAVERDRRLVVQLRREFRGVMLSNVREICDDQVKGAVDFFEKVALRKLNPLRNPEPVRIFAGERKRLL